MEPVGQDVLVVEVFRGVGAGRHRVVARELGALDMAGPTTSGNPAPRPGHEVVNLLVGWKI